MLLGSLFGFLLSLMIRAMFLHGVDNDEFTLTITLPGYLRL